MKKFSVILLFLIVRICFAQEKEWLVGTNIGNTLLYPLNGSIFIAPEIRFQNNKGWASLASIGYSNHQDKYPSKQISQYTNKGIFISLALEHIWGKSNLQNDIKWVTSIGLTYSNFSERADYEFRGNAFPSTQGRAERNAQLIAAEFRNGMYSSLYRNKIWFYIGIKNALAFPWGLPPRDAPDAFSVMYVSGVGRNVFRNGKEKEIDGVPVFAFEVKLFVKVK